MIFGLGFDRWHFIGKFIFGQFYPTHLVSIWSKDKFIYINYDKFPCPILKSLTDYRKTILQDFLNRKPDQSPKESVEKLTRKEAKQLRLKSIIDAMKQGEKVSEFAQPITKRKK